MTTKNRNCNQLSSDIKQWALELGFSLVGITDTQLQHEQQHMQEYLSAGHQAEMSYLEQHAELRLMPNSLVPETKSIICCAINYWPEAATANNALQDPNKAYISRYTLGRDYHKVLRKKLNKLAKKIEANIGAFNYRCFTDSAPVLEKALAIKAGIGWQGNNSLLINPKFGSWFFLGEIYTDLDLQYDQPLHNQCGNCHKCQHQCPTQAIIAPQLINAERCIAYWTLEHRGIIPESMRPLIGNRICGCDDCQLACPWNQKTPTTLEADFNPRHNFDNINLTELFLWSEEEFLANTEGSAIRRIGYECWLRNIAVALGNAATNNATIAALTKRLTLSSELVTTHAKWALERAISKHS